MGLGGIPRVMGDTKDGREANGKNKRSQLRREEIERELSGEDEDRSLDDVYEED
jgi:hypothetical protein